MRINHTRRNINITSGRQHPRAAAAVWRRIALFVSKECTRTAAASNRRDRETCCIQFYSTLSALCGRWPVLLSHKSISSSGVHVNGFCSLINSRQLGVVGEQSPAKNDLRSYLRHSVWASLGIRGDTRARDDESGHGHRATDKDNQWFM